MWPAAVAPAVTLHVAACIHADAGGTLRWSDTTLSAGQQCEAVGSTHLSETAAAATQRPQPFCLHERFFVQVFEQTLSSRMYR